MFSHLQHIDSALRYIRWVTITVIVVSVGLCGWVAYHAYCSLHEAHQKVYILSNGKLLEAFAADRKEKLPVEVRDHVASFHRLFFTLEPDESFNRSQLTHAFYLCDSSARDQYKLLENAGYYAGILAGNVSQRPVADSIIVNLDQQPWSVTYYGKLVIVRSTSVVTRSLITTATVRDLESISDNNPHGFLLEGWRIIENKDLDVKTR